MEAKRYDIIIIGTGAAGISAAITAKQRNKSFLLVGSRKLGDKLQKAELIRNYPGLPEVSGPELAAAFTKHLAAMEIEITEKRAAAVYAMGEYFAVQLDTDMVECTSVILAAGVTLGRALPGEVEFLGRGVSYCATCDAPLYKGKKVIILGYNKEAEAEAEFLGELAAEVVYFPMYKGDIAFSGQNISIVRDISRDMEIFGAMKVQGLRTPQATYKADGIFVLRDSIAPGQLVPGLAIKNNHVEVDLQMQTNLPGVFACGDIAGQPYQYVKAAGQGNVAALSAVAWVDKLKKKV